MQLTIPKLLEEKNLLKTLDSLSYVRYVNYTPMRKGSVKIQSNALIYVTKGVKILHFEEQEKEIKAGDVLFVKSGNYIMSEVLDEIYEALIFFYSDTLLNEFIHKYHIQVDSKEIFKDEVFIVRSNSFLQNGLLSIIPYFENTTLDKNLVRLKLEEIFLNIFNSDKSFHRFLTYVYNTKSGFKSELENIYEEFENIKELADHFKMSESAFRAKFKEVFQITPKKWILFKKLKKAKLLLEQNELNVSEVCMKVGFANLSWFIQSFKKEFGFTPKTTKNNKNKIKSDRK